MIILHIIWEIVKGVLHVAGAILGALGSAGDQLGRETHASSLEDSPAHNRTSAYYSGPGHRP